MRLSPRCRSPRLGLLLVAAAALCSCEPDRAGLSPAASAGADCLTATASHPTREPAASPAPPETLVLVAGGDVSFGRETGQLLRKQPQRNELAMVQQALTAADVSFVNLEGPLSEQHSQTGRGSNPLVFAGPPAGARVLASAGVDVVSLANNHAWDYGRDALLETMKHLRAAGVAPVGAGLTRRAAYAAHIVPAEGDRHLAVLAVTDVWNQTLRPHPGKDHIADAADEQAVLAAIRAARADPAPRAGSDFAQEHTRAVRIEEGWLETKDRPKVVLPAAGYLELRGGMHLLAGADAAIIDGAVALEL